MSVKREISLVVFGCLISFITSSTPQPDLMRVSVTKTPPTYPPATESSDVNTTGKEADGFLAEQLNNYHNVQYYGQIGLGTPPQLMTVGFDSGSADLWVDSYFCEAPCCSRTENYIYYTSLSYQSGGRNFSLVYGDGSGVEALVNNDTLTISGVTVRNQTFGEALYSSFCTTYSGVFGLGHMSLSKSGGVPPLYNMFHQGLIPAPVFSVFLANNAGDGVEKGGEIIFGGSDPQYYIGQFYYSQVTPQTTDERWMIHMTSLYVNDVDYCAAGVDECEALVDTGTSFILGPVMSVYSIAIQLRYIFSVGGYYYIFCSTACSLPPLLFVINNVTYSITSDKYVIQNGAWCMLALHGNDNITSFSNTWVLGDSFLRSYYTEFDLVNNRIGFAQLSGPSSAVPVLGSHSNLNVSNTGCEQLYQSETTLPSQSSPSNEGTTAVNITSESISTSGPSTEIIGSNNNTTTNTNTNNTKSVLATSSSGSNLENLIISTAATSNESQFAQSSVLTSTTTSIITSTTTPVLSSVTTSVTSSSPNTLATINATVHEAETSQSTTTNVQLSSVTQNMILSTDHINITSTASNEFMTSATYRTTPRPNTTPRLYYAAVMARTTPRVRLTPILYNSRR